MHGFSGCRCVPGDRDGELCPGVCDYEESSFGDSSLIHSEYIIPIIWFSICTAYSRGGSGISSNYGAHKTFQKAGEGISFDKKRQKSKNNHKKTKGT